VRVLHDQGFEFPVAPPEPMVVTARLAQLLLEARDLMLEMADLL
jgi:hypothetical protein